MMSNLLTAARDQQDRLLVRYTMADNTEFVLPGGATLRLNLGLDPKLIKQRS